MPPWAIRNEITTPSIVTFTASRTSLFVGSDVTLTYDFDYGTGVILLDGSGSIMPSGVTFPEGAQGTKVITLNTAGTYTYRLQVTNSTSGNVTESSPITITALVIPPPGVAPPVPIPYTLAPQTFYLDLTRSVEPSNNQLTAAVIPEIPSDLIQNFSIMNIDISANADISGSKIQSATVSNSGVITATTQDFSGAKTFASGFFIKGSMTRDEPDADEPMRMVRRVTPLRGLTSLAPSERAFGSQELMIRSVNTTSTNNFLNVVLRVPFGYYWEVSSCIEVTVIGKQPIYSVDNTGTTVTALPAVSSTVRCLITVTGIQVTTTFFGQTDSVPLITTKLQKFNSGNFANATNLVIGIGFRNYSAYHVKTVKSFDSPFFYLLHNYTDINTQTDAQNLFDTVALQYT
jgi:hypothetical protein